MTRFALALLLVGCTPPDEPPPEPTPPPGCDVPTEGFDRFDEVSAEIGVDLPPLDPDEHHPYGQFLSPAAIVDLDDDGDLDLAFGRPDGAVDLYRNDGTGHFDAFSGLEPPQPGPGAWNYHEVAGQFFVDLDGDRLPDLLRPGFGLLAWLRNAGDFTFGPPTFPHLLPGGAMQPLYGTLGVGDLDGDGDLDLVLPTLHGPVAPGNTGPLPGASDLVLERVDEGFVEAAVLQIGGLGSMSQLAMPTDRDGDGDLDLYIGADLKSPEYPPAGLFRNDGGFVFVEEAASLALDHRVSAMGGAGSDWNRDGQLDYCVTDVGPVVCVESLDGGPYVDRTAAWGLEPAALAGEQVWTGWSVALADLDNDGREDLAVAAGRPDDVEGGDGVTDPFAHDHPDGLWRRTDDGWQDEAPAVGFDSLSDNYGLAAGDLDGDGWLDLVVAGHDGPRVWRNRCGWGAWLEVDVDGPPGNGHGLGAWVEVHAGGVVRIQEVPGPATVGQPPPRLHFGLGEAETVERVVVRWPDGAEAELAELDPRQVVRVPWPG